jgi:hypothetical protein
VRKEAAKSLQEIASNAKAEYYDFEAGTCNSWTDQACIDGYIRKQLREYDGSGYYGVPLATAKMKYTRSGEKMGFKYAVGTRKYGYIKPSSLVIKINQQTFNAKIDEIQLRGAPKKANQTKKVTIGGSLSFSSGTQYYNFQKALSTLPSGSKIVYQGKTPKLKTKATVIMGIIADDKKGKDYTLYAKEKISGLQKLSNKKFKITQTVKG